MKRVRRPKTDILDTMYMHGVHIPTRTINLFGGIDPKAFVKVSNNLLVLSQTPEPITILLNSPGGYVIDGWGIIDLISNLANHVTIRVMGEASSMGALILQAADHRVMGKNACLMFHDGATSVNDMVARDFDRYQAFYKKERAQMYALLAERTGKPASYYKARLGTDWYLNATDALKEGLVDEIA